MNEKIVKIKLRIVNPDNLFREITREFKKRKIENIYFLMPDKKSGNFVTRYPTHRREINLTKKEIRILGVDNNFNNRKKIIFPKEELKQRNYSIVKLSLITKLKWKIWRYKIHAIMPIYLDEDKILCLILFCHQLESWFKKEMDYLKKIKFKIEFCLGSIFLYNEAFERIIRKKDLEESE